MGTAGPQSPPIQPHYRHGPPPKAAAPAPVADAEPNEEWKENLRLTIQIGFQPMIQEAKERLEKGLQDLNAKGVPLDSPERRRYHQTFQEEAASIRQFAQEQFEVDLAKERVTRRLILGGPVSPMVQVELEQEQSGIWEQIQRNNKASPETAEPSVSASSSQSAPRRESTSEQATQRPSEAGAARYIPSRTPPTTSSVGTSSQPSVSKPPPQNATWKSPATSHLDEFQSHMSTAAVASSPPAPFRGSSPTVTTAARPIPAATRPNSGAASAEPNIAVTPISHASGFAHRNSTVEENRSPSLHTENQRVGSSSPIEPNTRAPSVGASYRSPTTQTRAESSSSPSQAENHRTTSSPLGPRRSQSNFNASLASSASKSEPWTRSELTDEPEELITPERGVPLPSARLREGLEKPLASSPPASRQLPEVWRPSMTPEEDAATSTPFAFARSGSLRSASSSIRASMPSFAEQPTPPNASRNTERAAEERRNSGVGGGLNRRPSSFFAQQSTASNDASKNSVEERRNPGLNRRPSSSFAQQSTASNDVSKITAEEMRNAERDWARRPSTSIPPPSVQQSTAPSDFSRSTKQEAEARRDSEPSGATRRPSVPLSFGQQSTPADDISKNVQREAEERREAELPWEGVTRSREKEKGKQQEQARATRQSTASEQVSRPVAHVSVPPSHSDGSSTSGRPPDSVPFHVGGLGSTASHSDGIRVSAHVRPASPSATSGASPSSAPAPSTSSFVQSSSTSNDEPLFPDRRSPYSGISHMATFASPLVQPPPPSKEEPLFPDRRSPYSSGISHTATPAKPEETTNHYDNARSTPITRETFAYPQHAPPSPAAASPSYNSEDPLARYGGEGRAASSSYPIPVPSRSPRDAPSVDDPGSMSRYGIVRPPEARPETTYGSYSEFPPSSIPRGSFSSRDEELAATERELQQRALEAERLAKRAEEEAQRKVDEARRKEEEARRKEEEARLKEEATQKKEAQLREQMREINEKEADLKRREADLARREAETKRKDAAREEEERQKNERERERRKAEAEKQYEQQREFQAREAKIRADNESKRRQDSYSAETESARSGSSSSWNTPPRSSPAPSSATSSSARSNSTSNSSSWSNSSRASSTTTNQSSASARTPTGSTPNGKPTWGPTPPTSPPYSTGSHPGARPSSASMPKPTSASSQSTPPPVNLEERQRQQREKAEEQFRKLQEQMERERQAKEMKAGRMLSKEDVARIYQQHEQQWSKMSAHSEVTWDMMPWPMYKRPSNPEDITSGAVDAYILSPHYPDQDKSTKDRVRQLLRRWHEDHFNQKVLSKVSEGDKERVKQAAGLVTRNLNNLLERANESKKSASAFG
ncbi:hypothetical protein C8J57DRAFT_237994 [Mycena rebaudengoi]|nr:hypothetical protein C8J57DRAFT_237994 [Mycena rebaudengoi]